MKRYLLFSQWESYSNGAKSDFRGDFDTMEALEVAWRATHFNIANILDTQTGEWNHKYFPAKYAEQHYSSEEESDEGEKFGED